MHVKEKTRASRCGMNYPSAAAVFSLRACDILRITSPVISSPARRIEFNTQTGAVPSWNRRCSGCTNPTTANKVRVVFSLTRTTPWIPRLTRESSSSSRSVDSKLTSKFNTQNAGGDKFSTYRVVRSM